jgi:hypothetical protein
MDSFSEVVSCPVCSKQHPPVVLMSDQRTNPATFYRFGYFAAKAGTHHGDLAQAYAAEEWWKSLGHTAPSVVDGVGCLWTDPRESPRVRVTALDIFSAQPLRTITKDRIGGQWT